ncbi:hypothetical protein [Ornithinimicrobium cryptoxanthini]|uniref:Uncharacterized protein n=1 Tax=Ornithinimicrobium cryptoxanthini TaxID=2934161 RepID=A0ABY4YF73_9MICO|nr:hypothetical protein [Ornithinimicrobium cryptoxanthini]USQ75414.1 hypothetical protein NF557_12385 [Ornithinimicrobium cryptoxanthini]
MTTTEATPQHSAEPDHSAEAEQTPWLLRDPIRTGFLAILLLSLAVRYNILRDSFFITDDFMLQSRAMDHELGWDYLTRVHTGHFEPIGFGFMWLLTHLAPWNWTVAMLAMLVAQALVAILVWRMLTELFTRRAMVLVPFALYCLTPLTIPAYTWLSAAIIWLPLTAALAGAIANHAVYLRSGRWEDAVWAVFWFCFGLASFEKIVIYLPFIAVLSLALSPTVSLKVGEIVGLVRRTWVVWAGYAAASVAYLVIYLDGSSRAEASTNLAVPSLEQLSEFVYLSLFRTMIPGSLGGPWDWQPASYAGAMVDSPRLFDWVCWIVFAAIVVVSLITRRRIGRAWVALLVYLGGSIAALGIGRVAYSGPLAALETRYLADTVVPLVVVIGMCLMALDDEQDAWLPQARRWAAAIPRTTVAWTAGVACALWLALSLHSANGYAEFSAANPYKNFVKTTEASLRELPEGAQIFDTPLPVNLLGPLFMEYNDVSRFVAPVATPEQRADLATREFFDTPLMLTPEGTFEPFRVEGFASPAPLEDLCGWQPVDGRAAVPLTDPAYPWGWAVRVGYLSDGPTTGTIHLGEASQEVEFKAGLGEVFVSMVAGGSEVVIDGVDADVNICFGDAQVGNPVPVPAE